MDQADKDILAALNEAKDYIKRGEYSDAMEEIDEVISIIKTRERLKPKKD
jgi:hypothetical protein